MMKKYTLFIPWALVCIATIASLFMTEITHRDPCTLCWYQRVSLFPLAIILGLAAFRNAYRIVIYALPLSLLGMLIALYHVILITFYSQGNLCAACTLKGVSNAPVLVPLLSLLTFLAVNLLLIWIYLKHKNSKKL